MPRWLTRSPLHAIRDRFRMSVAFGIVIVSILAASMAWRSSVSGERASSNDEQARQERVELERTRTAHAEQVNQDIRVFNDFEQATLLARELNRDARGAEVGLARRLRREAGVLRAEASLLQRSFTTRPPTMRSDERVVFSPASAADSLLAHDRDLEILQPNKLAEDARVARGESVRLTGLAALFVAALLFLTLAEIAGRAVSRWFAGAGALTGTTALALYLLAG